VPQVALGSEQEIDQVQEPDLQLLISRR